MSSFVLKCCIPPACYVLSWFQNLPVLCRNAGWLAFLWFVISIDAQKVRHSNCNMGYECEACKRGQYKRIRILTTRIAVCCPDCSDYFLAGNKKVGNKTVPYCSCFSPEDIEGDCWIGEQCKTCLRGPNHGYVGAINTIPVCCQNCERSGLLLGLKLCKCLHNGP